MNYARVDTTSPGVRSARPRAPRLTPDDLARVRPQGDPAHDDARRACAHRPGVGRTHVPLALPRRSGLTSPSRAAHRGDLRCSAQGGVIAPPVAPAHSRPGPSSAPTAACRGDVPAPPGTAAIPPNEVQLRARCPRPRRRGVSRGRSRRRETWRLHEIARELARSARNGHGLFGTFRGKKSCPRARVGGRAARRDPGLDRVPRTCRSRGRPEGA